MKYSIIPYPTEFSKMKRVLVNTPEELNRLIHLNNFRTDCFATVYQSKKVIEDTIIDRLFYDYDTGTHTTSSDNPKCYTNIIRAHEIFMNDDIVHRIYFSGRGYHSIIYTTLFSNKDITLNEYQTYDGVKKTLLYNCHRYFTSKDIGIDKQVGKDASRMIRIPNTWNLNGKRFCIPLNEDMLYSGHEHIQELAKTQQNTFTLFGSEPFDLSKIEIVEVEQKKIHVDIDDNIIGLEFLLPCAKYVVNMVHPGHYQKLALVYELIKHYTIGQKCDRGILINNIEKFIWKYCKWVDLNSTALTRNNIECAVDTINFGYSCKSKRDLGICVEGCKFDKINL